MSDVTIVQNAHAISIILYMDGRNKLPNLLTINEITEIATKNSILSKKITEEDKSKKNRIS